MSLLRNILGSACCTVACTALLCLAPLSAAGQQGQSGKDDAELSLYGNDAEASDLNFSGASFLDPAIQEPQQFIQPSQPFEQSSGQVFAPLPCGPLKHVFFTANWMHGDDLGFTDFELTSKWGWINVKEHSLLMVTPGLGVHFVDGPDSPDLPAQLYDLSLDVRGLIPFSQSAAVEVGLTPGLFSDFEQDTDDGFRFGARVVGYYLASPALKFALGAAYLDRFDVEFLIVGGIVWTPNVDTNLELTFPRGKLARRFSTCGHCEDWWFLVMEFAGGAWSIERTTGAVDIAAYRDLRLSIGWERRTTAGLTGAIEIGYVFNRHLEYETGLEYEPDDTFMIKGTLGF